MWLGKRLGLVCVVFLFAAGCEMPKALRGNDDNNRMDDDSPPNQILGRVCHAPDFRFPHQCGGANLKGVEIRESKSGQRALGESNGDFLIGTASGASSILLVGFGNPGAIPSVMTVPLDKRNRAENVSVPLADPTAWRKLAQTLNSLSHEGTASLLVQIVRSKDPKTKQPYTVPQPVAGASLLPQPGLETQAFYNRNGALDWVLDGQTGNTGAIIVYNVEAQFGTTELTVLDAGSLPPFTVALLPVVQNAISYVTVDISPLETP